MNLPRFFRRTRPTPPPPPSLHPQDVKVSEWYGLTPKQWSALDNPGRAHYRTIYFEMRMP